MADLTGLRRSPLDGLSADIRNGAAGEQSVRLLERPWLTMVSLRVDPRSEAARRIEQVLGTRLPRACGEVTSQDAHDVLWLGPDEWLVVSQMGADVLVKGVSDALAELRDTGAAAHAAVVDVSANRTVLEISGPSARGVLEKGCPADLHPRAFDDGTAIATTLARIPLLLWKVDPNLFRLLPRGSFAPYVARWLLDAMQEFTPDRPALRGA
ncbi:sarcosine oxidase subunit gamma [Micromonospora sp. KC606]|uniref:sarcosine oxidase subunit gamma n=1 Tax=Micromonospora sp. KC606 TaxID=2530379 RepID=UPI001051572D|nr:sarcosine oxidase subunit gamma family protein [Micromonospora sp. KC606]TDC85792.1 sarcosine oxidase subunit gamma [Micromonospora sp. KC606]